MNVENTRVSARVPVGRADQALHDAAHRRRLLAFQRFELVFEAAARRQADDRRQVEGETLALRICEPSANVGRSGPAPIGRAVPVREWLQLATMKAEFGPSPAIEQREADDREHVLDRRLLLEQRLDLPLGHLAGARH